MVDPEDIHAMSCRNSTFYISLVILFSFYIYVAYLILHPNVSNIYHMYYIDNKLLNWCGGAGITYHLGDIVEFSKPVPYLSRTGWSAAESWGTWSEGKVSEMYLQIHEKNKPNTLTIYGHPFISPKHNIISQRIDVYVNNIWLGANVLSSDGEASFIIPPTAVSDLNSILNVRFEYSNPQSPKKLGLSSDDRILGFGFVNLVIR